MWFQKVLMTHVFFLIFGLDTLKADGANSNQSDLSALARENKIKFIPIDRDSGTLGSSRFASPSLNFLSKKDSSDKTIQDPNLRIHLFLDKVRRLGGQDQILPFEKSEMEEIIWALYDYTQNKILTETTCSHCNNLNGVQKKGLPGVIQKLHLVRGLIKDRVKSLVDLYIKRREIGLRLGGGLIRSIAAHGAVSGVVAASTIAVTWPLYTFSLEVIETLFFVQVLFFPVHYFCYWFQVKYFNFFRTQQEMFHLFSDVLHQPFNGNFEEKIEVLGRLLDLKSSVRKIESEEQKISFNQNNWITRLWIAHLWIQLKNKIKPLIQDDFPVLSHLKEDIVGVGVMLGHRKTFDMVNELFRDVGLALVEDRVKGELDFWSFVRYKWELGQIDKRLRTSVFDLDFGLAKNSLMMENMGIENNYNYSINEEEEEKFRRVLQDMIEELHNFSMRRKKLVCEVLFK